MSNVYKNVFANYVLHQVIILISFCTSGDNFAFKIVLLKLHSANIKNFIFSLFTFFHFFIFKIKICYC